MASLTDVLALYGGLEDDALSGGIGSEAIHGDGGDDTLSGFGGDDTLIGGLGSDLLFGGSGANVLYGGAGDDILTYDSEAAAGALQRLFGGDGTDTLVLEFSQEDYLQPGVIDEVLGYATALAAGEDPGAGAEFVFQSFALRASGFSGVLIFVDGDPVAPGEVPGVDAVDDAFAVTESGAVSGDVTLNDNVPAGAVVSLLAPPAAGDLTLAADGSFTFTAAGAFETLGVGETATATFSYRLTDDDDASDAEVAIAVSGENDAPTANAATGALDENAILNGDLIADSGAADADRNDVLSILSVNGRALGGAALEIALPSGAQLTVMPSGGYAYEPGQAFDGLAAGDTATETIAFVIADGQGGEVASTLTLTIAGANDGPVAVEDTATTTEDETVIIDVVLNDTDIDQGDALTLVSIDGITGGGTATITGEGQILFDPRGDFDSLSVGTNAFVEIGYTVADGSGARSSSTATVTVSGVNDAPTAGDAAGAVSEDAVLTGNLLTEAVAADVDSADVLTIAEIDGVPFAGGFSAQIASGAMLTVMANGDYVYSPTAAFNALGVGETATDSFAFTVTDGRGGTVTRTFSITVTGENDGPVAQDFTVGAAENGVAAVDFLADSGAFDPDDGGTLSVAAINGTPTGGQAPVFAGSNGGALTQGLGGFTFDTLNDFEELSVGDMATTTFTFTIEDDQGASVTRTLTVEVQGRNDDPTADPVGFLTDEDTAATGNLLAASGAGDIDQNDTLVITEILSDGLADGALNGGERTFTLASGAALTVAPDGTFTFQPSPADQALNPDERNRENFAFRISDGQGGEVIVSAEAVIDGVNDDPTADAITRGALEDDTASGNLLADSNAADVDNGDALRISAVDGQAIDTSGALIAGAEGGTLFVTELGGYTFNPNGEFEFLSVGDVATTSFSFRIADRFGGFVEQTISFEVAGANDAPEVDAITAATDEDTAFSGDFLIDGNATDVDQSDVLSIDAILFDSPASGPLNGATRTFALPSGAEITVSPDGAYTYDPLAAFQSLPEGDSVVDVLTFRVADGNGGVAQQSLTITVDGVNDAPTLDPIAVTLGENASDEGDFIDDSNAADIDQGDTVTVFALEGQDFSAGTVTITRPGDGRLEALGRNYTYETQNDFDFLSVGETATTSYEFTVSDRLGATATTTITFTIVGENDGPTANDIAQATTEDDILDQNLLTDSGADDVDQSDVLTISRITIDGVGVFDLNGAPLTQALANGAVLTVNPDGDYQIDPAGNFEGLAPGDISETSFNFTVSDGNGGEVERNAVISITGVNDAPVAVDDAFATDQDSAIPVNVLANDSDVDGVFSRTSFTQPASGGRVIDLQGLVFDPNGDFDFLGAGEQATTVFTYTITDDLGATDVADVTITVTGLNDAPVTAPINAVTDEDRAAFMVDLLAGQTDIDQNDILSVENFVEIDTNFGDFTVVDGIFTIDARQFDFLDQFDPNNPDETSRTIDYSYEVVDVAGARVTNTLRLTIEGRDEALEAIDDAFTTDEDTVLNGDVSLNDTIGTGEYALDQDVGAGLLTLNIDGTFTFDPNGEFDGLADGDLDSVTFTYILDDGVENVMATATIDITGVNDGPIADDVLFETDEDNIVEVDLIDESNATDPDATGPIELDSVDGVFLPLNNDDETITLLSGAVITARRDGFISYDPNGVFNDLSQDEFGLDSFTFELVDDFGDGISVLADVDILGVNDPVEADDSSFDADEDTGAADNLIGLSNVFDPDVNDVIETGVVEGVDVTGGVTVALSSGALLTIGEDGEFTYDTNGQFDGLAVGETDTESFTYTITDGFSAIDLVSTVTINGANDAVVIDEAASDLADTFTSTGGGTGTGGGAPVVSARTLDGTDGFALFGETNAIFSGFAVAGAGDFNGDGFGDVVVGSPSYVGFYATDSGSAFVLFGNGASPQPATRDIPNVTPESDGLNFIGGDLERIATDAAFVGDVNGDGFDDFLVGNGDPQIGGQVGVARLVFGQSPTNFSYQYLDASTSTLFIDSTTTYSGTRNIGYSVASAGDVNNDGVGDLFIGAPFTAYTLGDQNFGKAFVVYGQDAGGGGFGATFDLATLDGTNGFRIDDGATDLGSQLGFDVSGVGDVNGDGIDDIFVGSPGVRQSVPTGGGEYVTYTTGASYIIFGTDDAFGASFDVKNIDSTTGLVLTEPYSSTRVGQGVAGIGDFNGDGIDDFIVGADYGRNEGAAFIVFGSNTPSLAPIDVSRLEPSEGFKILGGGNYSFVGRAMDAAGDVNGDGFDDVILGAPRDYEGFYVGEAYILFGTDQSFTSPFDLASFDADDGIRLTGFDTGDRFGIRVSGAGDLNEDGFDDVIVGSPTATDDRNGAAFVFFGSVGGAATGGGEVGGVGSVFFDDIDISDVHVTDVTDLNNDDDDVTVDFALVTDSTGGFTGEAEWRADINRAAFDALPEGQIRTEAFDLTVDDQNGGADTVRLEVSFLGVNDAPTSQDVTGTTDEDTVFTGGDLFVDGMIDDVDDGDTLRVSQVIIEIDGGELTFDLSPFPSSLDIRGATLSIGENGQFSVDPRGAFDFLDTGEQSSVSFDYVVEDQAGATSRRSSVTIAITGVNDEPTANDDAATTDQDTVALLDLFANDDDPESNIAITSLDDTLTAGVVTIEDAATGSVTYDPNGQFDFLDDGEQATDTFSYTITDSGGLTSTANVTVTIMGLNDAPRAFDLTISATEDDTVLGGYIVDSGSFDPDASDTPVVQSVDGEAIPAGGTVVTLGSDSTLFMAPNGTFTYDPRPGSFQSLAQGETGQDVISIVISDGDITDTADLIVNVTGANDAPTAPQLQRTTNEDVNAFVVDLLANAADVDNGDTLRIENFAEDGTNFGSFFVEVSTFTYDATIFDDLDAGQSQIVNFTYDVVDSFGARTATSLELTIEGRDEVLLAVDDDFSTDEDSSITRDVSTNDTSRGGTFSLVTLPVGDIIFNPDGTFTYDPTIAFNSLDDGAQTTDTFTYQIDDGTNQVTAEVTITIDGINDAPGQIVPGVTDVRLVTENVTDEEGGDNQSLDPAISGDGDTVVFDSSASNLIMGDTNARTDVYFEDPAENVDRASVQNGTNAQITTDGASTAEVSADGRTIVFQSRASDLDPFAGGGGQPIPNNNRFDIYARDLDAGATQLMIPVGFDGARLNGDSVNASISADGRFVAFESTAFNIVADADDNNSAVAATSLADIFLHDRQTGETQVVSQRTGTTEALASFRPTISADGGAIAFLTANSHDGVDTNGLVDVYVYDVAADALELISQSSAGVVGDQAAVSSVGGAAVSTPSISANGRYVSWVSRATNLVDDDTNNADDIFVHDRVTGETERVSVTLGGLEADNASFDTKLSDNGRFVTFQSRATNLDEIFPDTNGDNDIYVKDRLTGDVIRVSITPDFASQPGGEQPDISADGAKIAFASGTVAGNFDPRVTTGAVNDIYVASVDQTGFAFSQNDTVAFVDLEGEWFDPDGFGLDFSAIDVTSDNPDRVVAFTEVIDGGRVVGVDLDPFDFADLGANDYELLTVAYDLTDGVANTSGVTGVIIIGENDAPTADDQTFDVNPGETISGNFVADDVDGDTLTFSFASAVQGEFSLAEDGSFFYQATPGQADDVISIDVSDGNGGFASFIATFDANQPPTFTAPADIPIAFTDEVITTPNNAIDTSAFFNDPEGANLTFSAVQVGLSRLPRGLAIDAVTGVISGTPLFGEVGLPRISVTATDEDGVSATGEFWLAIAGEQVNGDADANNIVDGATTSFIDGLGGNDSITGDNNADVYQYRRGDGFDIIDDTQSGGNNRLVMTGYNSDEVMFSRFSANPFDVNGTDVLITPVGQPIDFTEGVLVREALIPGAGPGELAFYHFDDGVILDEEFAIAQILERESTDGDDDIRGFGTNDTLVGGLGDDALSGGDGSDLYIYNPGDGDDTIRDNGNRDVDVAQIGFNLADAAFSRLSGTNDFTLDFGGGDRLTFINALANDAGDQIETYRFLDGDLTTGDIRNIFLAQAASVGNDVILGFSINGDLLEGGPGDDSMYGFDGADTYIYRAGDGDDLIHERGFQDTDVLQVFDFAVDYDPVEGRVNPGSEVTFERAESEGELLFQGETVIINLSNADSVTGSIEVIDGINVGNNDPLTSFIFEENGVTLTGGQIRSDLLRQQETEGDDIIRGFRAADTLNGGLGNDLLLGRDGLDIYQFAAGDGDDTVRETGFQEADRVAFTDRALADFDIFYDPLNINNVIFRAGDDRIEIIGGLVGGNTTNISFFDFTDQTVSEADMRQIVVDLAVATPGRDLIGTAGSQTFASTPNSDRFISGRGGADNYVFAANDGNDTIFDDVTDPRQADTLDLRAFNSTDFALAGANSIRFDPAFDNRVQLFVDTNNTLDLIGMDQFEQVVFADVTFDNDADDTDGATNFSAFINSLVDEAVAADPGEDVITKVIVNDPGGNNTLVSTAVNETFFLDNSNNDQVIFNVSEIGDDSLFKTSGTTSGYDIVIDFSGIVADTVLQEDVSLSLDPFNQHHLIIDIDYEDTAEIEPSQGIGRVDEQIVLRNALETFGGVDSITIIDTQGRRSGFNDTNEIRQLFIDRAVTAGDDVIPNYFAGGLVLRGGGGDDTLSSARGGQRYEFSPGDGRVTVAEVGQSGGGTDTVAVIGRSLTDAALRRSPFDETDLIFDFGSGDVLTISNFYPGGFVIEEFLFQAQQTTPETATGDEIATEYLNQRATSGDDILIGGNGRNETLDGGTGNDTLDGQDGSDTYVVRRGEGDKFVRETGTGDTDRLVLNVASTSITAEQNRVDPNNIIFVMDDGTRVEIFNFLEGNDGKIEEFVFTDLRAPLNTEDARLLAFDLLATDGNDRIIGGATDDTLRGGLGDDTLRGANGNDTFVYTIGDGDDVLIADGNEDAFEFIQIFGVNLLDVNFSRVPGSRDLSSGSPSNDEDLLITFDGLAGSIRIENGLSSADLTDRIRIIDSDLTLTDQDIFNAVIATDVAAGRRIVEGASSGRSFFPAGAEFIFADSLGDLFQFSAGQGTQTILDVDPANEIQRLEVLGYRSTDATFSRLAAGSEDFIIRLPDGDQIIIIGETNAGAPVNGVNEIFFDGDNIVFDNADITTLIDGGSATGSSGGGTGGSPRTQAPVEAAIEDSDPAPGDDDVLVLTGADDVMRLGPGDDHVRGRGGDDALWGQAGDDTLIGNAGADTLRGGRGEDELRGGGGRDKLIGGGGDDLLKGNGGRDMLKGGRGEDDLMGGAGRDVLKGGGGDDRLEGGRGDDRLLGQAGEDVFVFTRGFGDDVIVGFRDGDDRLDFTGHASVTALGDLTIAQDGADTVVTDGVGGRITLLRVDADDLLGDDFLF